MTSNFLDWAWNKVIKEECILCFRYIHNLKKQGNNEIISIGILKSCHQDPASERKAEDDLGMVANVYNPSPR